MGYNDYDLSPWEIAVSGTAASIVANVIVYPLDLVKTRLQVQVQQRKREASNEKGQVLVSPTVSDQYDDVADAFLRIFQKEGVSGLYSGLSSSILGTASMNFAYFYWSGTARSLHETIRRLYNVPDSNSIIKELGLGAVGGAMAQLWTNPLAVIITRQQTRKATEDRKSMWETTAEIVYGEDGWTGLWRGFKVNLILVVNPMITYGVYQWLRKSLLKIKPKIGPVDAFLFGALSKVLATIATHPLIVAKTMLQSKPPDGRQGRAFRGFTEVLLYIMRHEGFGKMYKGLWPQIVKGFLVQGLMMMLKERMELLLAFVLTLYKRRLRRASSEIGWQRRSLT